MGIATTEASAASTSHPPLECDLVMKGGITSGVVYPLAVCELAEGLPPQVGRRVVRGRHRGGRGSRGRAGSGEGRFREARQPPGRPHREGGREGQPAVHLVPAAAEDAAALPAGHRGSRDTRVHPHEGDGRCRAPRLAAVRRSGGRPGRAPRRTRVPRRRPRPVGVPGGRDLPGADRSRRRHRGRASSATPARSRRRASGCARVTPRQRRRPLRSHRGCTRRSRPSPDGRSPTRRSRSPTCARPGSPSS